MRVWIACLFPLALAACAHLDASCSALPGGGNYCLQSSERIPAFEVQQKIDFTFKEQRETMIAQLEVDKQGMRIVGLTSFGQKLVQASFDNEHVKADLMPDKRLDPAFLLGVIQLSTWPLEEVRHGLSAHYRLEGDSVQRRLFDGDVLILKIDYTRGRSPSDDLVIEFPTLGMSMQITNLESVDYQETPNTH